MANGHDELTQITTRILSDGPVADRFPLKGDGTIDLRKVDMCLRTVGLRDRLEILRRLALSRNV